MEEQLYLMALGLSLDEKLEKSIANLQHYEAEALKRDPVNGYYLCDSYGKDSCVILDLAKRAGVKFLGHYNLTTLDPPELIRFGRLNHPKTIVHKPAIPMLKMLTQKSNGPPTRLARWCCEHYKENAGGDSVLVFGVRAAESARRKSNWSTWQRGRNNLTGWIINPILYWTDEDVWRYIKQNNIPYCSLYDEGFSRLGCIGCPMSGKGRYMEFERWPKYEEAWKRAVKAFWDKWHNVPTRKGEPRWFDRKRPSGMTFQGWEDLWKWWMEELPEREDDGCQMGLW